MHVHNRFWWWVSQQQKSKLTNNQQQWNKNVDKLLFFLLFFTAPTKLRFYLFSSTVLRSVPFEIDTRRYRYRYISLISDRFNAKRTLCWCILKKENEPNKQQPSHDKTAKTAWTLQLIVGNFFLSYLISTKMKPVKVFAAVIALNLNECGKQTGFL